MSKSNLLNCVSIMVAEELILFIVSVIVPFNSGVTKSTLLSNIISALKKIKIKKIFKQKYFFL